MSMVRLQKWADFPNPCRGVISFGEKKKIDFQCRVLETASEPQVHLFVSNVLLKTTGLSYSQMTLLSKGISISR